jgi:uncharacterized protein with HEPN domain
MKTSSSRLFLEDIQQAMDKVERYVSGLTYETFTANEMVVDAVIRNIEIIGEAARNIPDDLREKYPEIPWKQIVGLRHIVAHRYFNIDLDIIWKIVTENLPETKSAILSMLEALNEET